MEAAQGPASPLEALAQRPPETRRGPGRPPGSGAKPKLVGPPAPTGTAPPPTPGTPPVPGAAPTAPTLESFDWGSVTDEEAADLIASGVDIGLSAFGLRPLSDGEVLPLRKHAKPVVKRWAATIFVQYMHEILLIAALRAPIMERIEERKRAQAQQQTTPQEPAPTPGPMGP